MREIIKKYKTRKIEKRADLKKGKAPYPKNSTIEGV